MSRWVGGWARCSSRRAVAWGARILNLHDGDAERPLHEYRSVAELFDRGARPEARPIDRSPNRVTSPCDGRFQGGALLDGTPLVVKGQRLSVGRFLVSPSWQRRVAHGSFFSVYLAPSDLHGVYAPMDGCLLERIHVPGTLYPVNRWGTRLIPDVFVRNERVMVLMASANLHVVVALVGATNVGSIHLTAEPDLRTNLGGETTIRRLPPIEVRAGAELGRFRLGSTVFVFTERKLSFLKAPNDRVRYGEPVAELS
ncbi:MAG: archaetidylserine decarboxylase [Myxococcota bacterium]